MTNVFIHLRNELLDDWTVENCWEIKNERV